MAQVQAYIRRRLLAPRHVVVETNGKLRDVKQEDESNDEGVKVVLSHTDHERAKRCAISGTLFGYVCSRNCGPNALGCEKRAQQGVLMVKSKSKSVPIGLSCSKEEFEKTIQEAIYVEKHEAVEDYIVFPRCGTMVTTPRV